MWKPSSVRGGGSTAQATVSASGQLQCPPLRKVQRKCAMAGIEGKCLLRAEASSGHRLPVAKDSNGTN